MSKHGKKYKKVRATIPQGRLFSLKEALGLIKENTSAGFDESIDLDVNLGIDPAKSEHAVRGSVMLPHGRGVVPRVIVFAKGEHADKATKAGADDVGSDDLVKKIESGWMDFDYAVATPDVMVSVGKLAKILGPRGLLPNKKLGTVTFDVDSIVSDLKKGKVFFKGDKGGLLHFPLGKVSHDVGALVENFQAFLKSLLAAKPPSAKGKFLRKMVISSTMGVGIPLNTDDLLLNKL